MAAAPSTSTGHEEALIKPEDSRLGEVISDRHLSMCVCEFVAYDRERRVLGSLELGCPLVLQQLPLPRRSELMPSASWVFSASPEAEEFRIKFFPLYLRLCL